MNKIILLLTLLIVQTTYAWSPSAIPPQDALKKKLTAIQYSVTQKSDTERPFKNEFWDNKKDGIYVDIVSGEPLFSSLDKFDSGTGWPSFTRPLIKENIVEKVDHGLLTTRTEIRSRHANSHLGHVFDDGPQPTGRRYCMNSAALRFVEKENLQTAGYGEFIKLFDSTEKKTFTIAAGCFWCIQPPFDQLKTQGVLSTIVGYTGGHKLNPTYEDVSAGNSGHIESIQVVYDPQKIKIEKLFEIFFLNIDPYDSKGQFCDKGEQYTSAFFYNSDDEKAAFENFKSKWTSEGKLKGTIFTKILPAKTFYAAEEYHQSYYTKNPIRYKYYRYNCGRDQRLKEIWEKK